MIVKQLSVFIENKKGRLSEALNALSATGIDISALSLADTTDFGVLRLIVDDPEKAKTVLTEQGIFVRINHVLAVPMNDVPGGAGAVLKLLAANDLNVEYMYAFVGRVSGKALTVLRTDDSARAENVLHAGGYGTVAPADIYRI